MCMCVFVPSFVRMCVCTCVFVCECAYKYVFVRVNMCICICLCLYECVNMMCVFVPLCV